MERIYPLAEPAKQHIAYQIAKQAEDFDAHMDFLEIDSYDKKKCFFEVLVRIYIEGHYQRVWCDYLKISYSDVQDIVNDILKRLDIKP